MSLQAGDHVPHFTVRDADGRDVVYSTIWQRRHLLLVLLGADPAAQARTVADVAGHLSELATPDVAVVITRDDVPGVPRPGVLIADRWGEIQFVAAGSAGAGAPTAAELARWLRYVQQRCPECEGESR